MKITIYTTPSCVQCRQTKKMFDDSKVTYDSIDLTQHPELAEQFKEAGLLQAPIVIASSDSGTTRWSGFRYDKIKATIARIFGESK